MAKFNLSTLVKRPAGVTAQGAPGYAREPKLELFLLAVANMVGGTSTEHAVRKHYAGHDRVVILTDEQAHWHGRADVAAAVPAAVPVYTWNLAGYRLGTRRSSASATPSAASPTPPSR